MRYSSSATNELRKTKTRESPNQVGEITLSVCRVIPTLHVIQGKSGLWSLSSFKMVLRSGKRRSLNEGEKEEEKVRNADVTNKCAM